jgi:inosose dehydratase
MSIRISVHGITWGRENFDQAVAESAKLGFTGFETFASVIDDFGFERIDDFKKVLSDNGLKLVALYGGGAMHVPAEREAVLANNQKIARWLGENGANRLVLGPGRRRPEGVTKEDLDVLADTANEIGRRSAEHGVLACFHPHVYTVVETLDEIDYVFERLDPAFVQMAADTAHFAKGNADVPSAEIQVFTKYADRIKYVHLKDWDPTLPPIAVGDGGTAIIRDFVELGQGQVDLAGCISILREHDYDGWVTIELDYTSRTPYESVAMSKTYLENELGLTV